MTESVVNTLTTIGILRLNKFVKSKSESTSPSLETLKINFAATNLNPWLQLFSKSTPSENILILKRNSKEF